MNFGTERIRFAQGSPFLADVRKRVDGYFADNAIPRTANAAMRWKTAFYFSAAVALWVGTALLPFPISLAAWGVLGFVLACIGFNVGHDAIHGSYSKWSWVNRALGFTFDLLGASSSTWSIAHNQVHHSYTNIVGADDDIEPGPWMRFHPGETPPRFMRFQHLYAWFLYAFTGMVWVFVKDFMQLRAQRATRKTIAKVVLGKVAHFAAFVGVPLALGAPWLSVLVGYPLMLAAAGLTLAIVFQLAHVVERVSFPQFPADSRMPLPWADHQMRTTANFGRTKLTTFITGALDHQVEHHLFPRICHIHYPKLAPIVEACARDHGIPYLHSGGFFDALASHARTLRALGGSRQAA